MWFVVCPPLQQKCWLRLWMLPYRRLWSLSLHLLHLIANIMIRPRQAHSQDLEKGGGGYFERVRSVQTTFTRIFIDLESISDGLSETWGEMSRKARIFKGFFRPKLDDLQKKKKKKKRSSPKLRLLFRPISQIQTFEGGCFRMGGGYFLFFTENRPQKDKKHAILHTSQANGGARAPPPPPPPGYATGPRLKLPFQ